MMQGKVDAVGRKLADLHFADDVVLVSDYKYSYCGEMGKRVNRHLKNKSIKIGQVTNTQELKTERLSVERTD